MEIAEHTPEPYFIQRLRKLSQEVFTLRMLGFMLSKAWVFAFFFVPSGFFGNASFDSLLSFDALSRNALILTLVVFGVRAAQWLTPRTSRLCCALAAAFSVAGTVFAAIPTVSEAMGLTSLLAAALLTGMGSGMLSIMWGIEYGRTTGSVTAAEVSVAYAFASFILPAYVLFPAWAQVLTLVALPIVSSLLLYYQRRSDVRGSRRGASESTNPFCSLGGSKLQLAKIAVSSMVFAVVIVVLRSVYERTVPLAPGDTAVMAASSALVGSMIVIALLVFSRRPETAFSYRPVVLLIAGGCFLLPMIESGTALPYFFARVGYICFLVLNIVMLSDLASRGSIKPGVVFGIGLASLSFGMFVGQLFVVLLENFGGPLFESTSALSGFLVFVLLITYVLSMTNRPDSSARGQVPTAEVPVGAQGGNVTIQTEAEFERRCQILSERAGISERACEVMVLYAKGRSKSRIEQELYISQSTVSFHLRNIYQKLDIHSRQELIDAIEQEPIFEEG